MKSRWCAMSTRGACQLARVRPCAASYRQGMRAGAEHVAVLGLLYLLDSHQDYDGARTEIVSTSTISSASVASNTASCIRLWHRAHPGLISYHQSAQQPSPELPAAASPPVRMDWMFRRDGEVHVCLDSEVNVQRRMHIGPRLCSA